MRGAQTAPATLAGEANVRNTERNYGFMQKLISSVACVLIAFYTSIAIGSVSIPLEKRIRRAVMESSYIVVGHIVETEPFLISDMARVSLLVVENSVSGAAAIHDTLKVHWSSGVAYHDNGLVSSVMDSGKRIDIGELKGISALWVLREKRGLRSSVPPLLLFGAGRERFERLADIVEFETTVKDESAWGNAQLLELQAEEESIAKRTAFFEYIRDAVKDMD